MDKVIVYGLGNRFERQREEIDASYEIVAYCDKNEERAKEICKDGERWIKPSEIMTEAFDYVLVIAEGENILLFLNKTAGVPFDRMQQYPTYLMAQSMLGESFSEAGEDMILDRLVDLCGLTYPNMHYIDIGIASPKYGDNTYYAYLRGARGILVEADPGPIDLIRGIRKEDQVLNRAIFEKDNEEITFYVCPEAPGLSSVHKEHIKEWPKELQLTTQEVKVRSITINHVFEMLESPCDILSIDIEGYDFQALSRLDFEKYRPKMVVVELLDSHWCREDNDKIVELLSDNGYVMYGKTRPNGIFVQKEILPVSHA